MQFPSPFWIFCVKLAYLIPNVLLGFVELLGQVFGRCFAGYFHHGKLLAIASHVARCLAHTVVVVFFNKKICEHRMVQISLNKFI